MHSLAKCGIVGAVALAVGSALAGCGAKTGLLVPDIASPPDATDVPVCMPARFELQRRSAEILFLIDRSTSMAQSLDGRMGVPREQWRWTILRSALATALPPFEARVEMGALFFPQELTEPVPDFEAACAILGGAGVDVDPRLNNSGAIVSVLDRTRPGGGTPTYEAIRRARSYLLANQTRGRAAFIVLATDGGPNCNSRLDYAVCACTSRDPSGMPTCAVNANAYNCLDDMRTLSAITATVADGIPVYVIGIDDPTRPDLTDVLNQMAQAGGRPNNAPGEPRYYGVRSAEGLTSAFATIQRSIAQCAFVTASPPADPDAVALTVNGMEVPRDETRRNGWDWTDPAFGEVAFFGPACERVSAGTATVVGRVGCRD